MNEEIIPKRILFVTPDKKVTATLNTGFHDALASNGHSTIGCFSDYTSATQFIKDNPNVADTLVITSPFDENDAIRELLTTFEKQGGIENEGEEGFLKAIIQIGGKSILFPDSRYDKANARGLYIYGSELAADDLYRTSNRMADFFIPVETYDSGKLLSIINRIPPDHYLTRKLRDFYESDRIKPELRATLDKSYDEQKHRLLNNL